jgi:hypothetical protein
MSNKLWRRLLLLFRLKSRKILGIVFYLFLFVVVCAFLNLALVAFFFTVVLYSSN